MMLTSRKEPEESFLQEAQHIAEESVVSHFQAHLIYYAQSLLRLSIILNSTMKARVQLIENSPLHKVPTVLLTIYKTQFIFNVIPTLLRHRKNHKINLFNSSHIFFTKNSIEALGGLPNYLLFRSGVENSNSAAANKIHLFGDKQIFNYLQKLRFKLGYKILRTSYCSWDRFSRRLGISNMNLYNQIKSSPQLPKIYIKIDDFIKGKFKKDVDYYESASLIQSTATKSITIPADHYHHELIDIYPLPVFAEGVAHTSFICIPTLRKKGVDINIEQFIHKTGIKKQVDIRQFISFGFIKSNSGDVVRKEEFLFREDFKPKDILIFHYVSKQTVNQLLKSPVLNNYFQNNNEAGLAVHIVQDFSIVQTPQFKQFMSKFKAKHLWFNKEFRSQQDDENCDDLHKAQLKLWALHFPALFSLYNIPLNIEKSIQLARHFPSINSFFYRKLYHLIINDYLEDQYVKRQEIQPGTHKINILKNLLINQESQINQMRLKSSTSINQSGPKVTFLGTASSMPTPYKNTLGILAALDDKVNIILDCGQGTYQQFAENINPAHIQQQLLKVRIIFITHIHSDHNLGILNFISERNKVMKKHKSQDKLFLIIPFNVYNWYESYNQTIQNLATGCNVLFTQILHNQNTQEIKEQIERVMENSVKTGKQSFFTKNKKIKQNGSYCKNDLNYLSELQTSSKTKELVLLQLPKQLAILEMFKQFLARNNYRQFKPIKVIHCPQSYGIVIQNNKYKISYSGDTRPSSQFEQAAKNSHLMIHEATFNDEEQQKAASYLHSTVFEAVQVGKNANAQKMAITHYNEDFQYPFKTTYPQQLQQYFNKNTIFSFDHLNLYLEDMEQLPSITQFIAKTDCQATSIVKTTKQVQDN